MTFTSKQPSPFYSEVLQQSELGKLCGSEQLFNHRYKMIRMLGRGGFGVTFLAKDMNLPGEPLCVIKQLCPKYKEPRSLETARERFEREAKTLSKLGTHSQIPMLLNYFVTAGEFYLVQEYIQGATLARLVRRLGPVSEVGVKGFLREMLSLLQYIHANQVIHRDIKPQNIIRCMHDGRLVLIDFGAVKEQLAPVGGVAVKESTTQFIGTIGFAPPEQFSLRPSYASDIFALGVTCIYLLTGKAPLDIETNTKTGELLWRKDVQISDSLAVIINKMVKISLKERFATAEAVLRAMDKESPQDNLAHCLINQPPRSLGGAKHKQPININDRAYTPVMRSAIAIRERMSRLQAKQQWRLNSKMPTFNTSGI